MRLAKYIDEMCGADHSKGKKKRKRKGMDEDQIQEGYTSNELGNLDNDQMVNAQFRDFNGNSTKWLGLNDKEALTALKKFVDARIKNLSTIRKNSGY